jgi:acetylornithine/succinyldiaminopimelate/putrescine aminotransferase
MEKQLLDKICEQIYRRFPEVKGKKPSVKAQPNDQFLLVFSGVAKTADGHSIPRTVRVVAAANGKVIKTTTSR